MTDVFPLNALTDNYIWIIPSEKTHSFICIDPGEASPVLEFADSTNWNMSHILLTHHHFDHVGGVEDLINRFPECVVLGPDDSRIPISHSLPSHTLSVENCLFDILKTHGHTSSHISYHEKNRGWLFCGDTLFSAGCGRVFDGNIKDLYESLCLYKSLPDETLVFCAHEYTRKNLEFARMVEPYNLDIQSYIKKLKSNSGACSLPSNIGLEKKVNPFLRTDVPAVQDFALRHGAASRDDLDVFALLREEKNSF